jgi:sucrose-6-phosphate hydrolase SacC (GH32 family)
MKRELALFLNVFILATASSSDPRNFSDPWLPTFHFLPYPFDWLNDPNGPFFDPVHNLYHLFYQYSTPRTWGHATSTNLIDWVQLPIALDLGESYDAGGDFSGSATVLNGANSTVLLTVSSSTGDIFLASPVDRMGDPYLTEWKYADMPATEPLFTPENTSRDPTSLLGPLPNTGAYQMFVGTLNGTALWEANGTGSATAFLAQPSAWKSRGLAHASDPNLQGPYFWECPDLFLCSDSSDQSTTFLAKSTEDADVWCSKYSLNGGVSGDWYYTGSYDPEAGVFKAADGFNGKEQLPQQYDVNPNFYASKSFLDANPDAGGRRVLWGWLKMLPWPQGSVFTGHADVQLNKKAKRTLVQGADDFETFDDDLPDSGGVWNRPWQNVLAVPRTLVLTDKCPGGNDTDDECDHRLRTLPLPGLANLRSDAPIVQLGGTVVNISSPDGAKYTSVVPPLGVAAGAHLDIEVKVRMAAPTSRTTKHIQCGVRVLLDTDAGAEYLDVMLPSLEDHPSTLEGGSLDDEDSKITRTMRVLVDGSVVEAFFDDGISPSATIFHYPKVPTAVGVAALASVQPVAALRGEFRASETRQGGEESGECLFETLDVFSMQPMGFDVSKCCESS